MAEALEAGSAYLQLMAGASGLQRDVDQKVKKVKAPDIIAKIDGDLSGLERKRAKAEQILDSLRTGVVAKADLDISVLEARKKVAEAKLGELDGKKASPEVELKAAKLNAEISRINGQLSTLNSRRASPEVDPKVAKAAADLAGIDRQMTKLNGQRATLQLGGDGAAKLLGEMQAVENRRRQLNGSSASVNIAAAGGAQASGMLGLIVAGLAAVAASAPAAVAGLGAVLGSVSALGQAGGAAAAGFSGIGDAIKAVEADEKSAATASAGAAASRTNSANQVASAQSSLAQAVLQADRAAITGGQQVAQARTAVARTQVQGAESVADAARSESRARMMADRAAVTTGQQLVDARRAVADAVVAASERTQAAERSVARSQESARFAQEGLTRARRDAAEANQDLQLSLSGIAISEKRAELSLRKALAAQAGMDAPEMFKGEELDLDVAEATQNLKEVRERFGDLREEQSRFSLGGIDGTDQVVAAQRAVRDANTSVEDSVRSLVSTQRDGSRSVADAVAGQARAQQEAAWSTRDAQDAVADAQRAGARAARDAGWANEDAATAAALAAQQSAWAQQDAARGISEAQRGLRDALAATAAQAGTAGAAGKQSAYELGKLTPAGRSFVKFWTGEWKPAMDDVSDSVAGEMLPRVERGMRNLLGIQPELKAGLSGTGAVLGDLAGRGADLATSPAFRASFVQIMDSNNRTLRSWGDAALSGADSARVLTVAGLPLSERLGRAAEYAAEGAESFLLQKESTGELGRAMEFGADKVGQLLDVGGDLLVMFYDVGEAVAPVGSVVLDTVGAVARFVGEFARGNEGLVQFIATGGIAVATLNGLAKATVAAQASYAMTAGGAKTLWSVLSTGLNPAALYNTQLMTRARDAAKNAGPAVSTYAQGLTGVRTTAEGATKVTSGFAKVATGLGSSLPLVGAALVGVALANDAVNTSFDEGVDKWGKGGAAAEEFRAEMARNDAAAKQFDGVGNWIRENWFGIQTSESFRAELEKQASQWSDLQRAQYNAGIAQGDYEEAVRRFGPASSTATYFLEKLKDYTREVEIRQIQLRDKTDYATAALIYQRDQILASLDADLRLRMSKQQLAQDQQALADAIRDSGAGSQEANTAQLQLEQTQLRTAEAAKASSGGQQAYTQSIKDMVAASKGEWTPVLAGMVASLGATDLAALGAKVRVDELGRTVVTMPNGKDIVVNVNDAQAISGLSGVMYQLGQVPPGKAITVTTLDADAQQKLRDLGFTVTTLPNGQLQVTANDAQARGTLTAFQLYADAVRTNPAIAADPQLAYRTMQGFLRDAGAQTGTPMLDADPARADRQVWDAIGRYNTTWGHLPVGADTSQADKDVRGWWQRTLDWMASLPFGLGNGAIPLGGVPGRADGGPIGFASGGSVPRYSHRQVFTGMDSGGRVRGPGTKTSDSVPIMGSRGEYMVRASAVDAVGVPFLDAINGMRDGGPVGLPGYAGGGQLQPAAAGAAMSGAAVSVPTGDPEAAGDAAAATSGLAGALGMAAGAAEVLDPALAAVTAQQQAMVGSGVSPLATALTGQLVPAVAAENSAVGVAAPLALQALQGAQSATQASTVATAANAVVNNAAVAGSTASMSALAQAEHAGLRAGQVATQQTTGQTAAVTAAQNASMAGSTTGMSLAAQAQHAALRAGQVATQLTTGQTAAVTGAQNAGMAASTTGMSLQAQAQHAGLRAGQLATQGSSQLTAAVMGGSNVNMQSTTGNMSSINQGHLAGLRGAQGTTIGSTTGFADSWRTQLGRTAPDSANPLRYVINTPIGGVVNAWNTIDQQFALGKHVNPPVAGFATGGVMPGYTPGRDTMTAAVSGGEAIMRPEWTRAVGRGYVDDGNAAARRGGVAGVRSFLAESAGPPRSQGEALQRLMRSLPLDDSPAAARSGKGWAGAFAYGGVAPHVAAAGDAVVRALGPMPGGIGGRGSRGNASDHPSGFALDFMTMRDMGLGDRVAGLLTAQAEPMAVKYLIWKQAINQGRGWNPMEDRGSPTANHFDHVHASFEGGPLGGTWGDGPAGGGGMFDFGSLIRDAFKFVFDQIAEVPRLFGPSDQVARAAGIPKSGANLAIDALIGKLGSMFTGGGGGVPDAALANLIIGVGKAMGFPRKGPEVALATAFQESGLRNLSYGDRDSLGAFQQRPSQGWGTAAQIMNPRYSAMKFYEALRGVGGWEGMPHAQAAQAVQRSAFPAAYAKWVGQAIDLVNKSGIYHDGGEIPGRDDALVMAQGGERVLSRTQNAGFNRMVDAVDGARFPAGALDVAAPSFDGPSSLVRSGGIRVDLGEFVPGGETHNHFFEGGTFRETLDVKQAMQAAEFEVGAATL